MRMTCKVSEAAQPLRKTSHLCLRDSILPTVPLLPPCRGTSAAAKFATFKLPSKTLLMIMTVTTMRRWAQSPNPNPTQPRNRSLTAPRRWRRRRSRSRNPSLISVREMVPIQTHPTLLVTRRQNSLGRRTHHDRVRPEQVSAATCGPFWSCFVAVSDPLLTNTLVSPTG